MLTEYGLYGDFIRANMTERTEMSGLKGKLKYDEPMSKHTSWRVGGPADRFYIPRDLQDLKYFLAHLPESEPVTWIGLGSNLLVRDGGIRGTVIAMKNIMDDLESRDNSRLRAGAGVACARLARHAVRSGLTGAEFLVGIPGTLGGALAMNAGAFGGETWDIVDRVRTVNRRGEERTRQKSDYEIGYRKLTGPAGEWFIEAELHLHPDSRQTGAAKLRELLARRGESQPIGQASCGSVFRNPDQDRPAAKLIEACGLKGMSVGNARVSEKHANFIINLGNATAGDIEKLIAQVQQSVYAKYKVTLLPEVQTVGEA
jgi:UDP-N-acetylmuramate dehydrogenase